jgi:repressor LexA
LPGKDHAVLDVVQLDEAGDRGSRVLVGSDQSGCDPPERIARPHHVGSGSGRGRPDHRRRFGPSTDPSCLRVSGRQPEGDPRAPACPVLPNVRSRHASILPEHVFGIKHQIEHMFEPGRRPWYGRRDLEEAMDDITARQRRILEFIRKRVHDRGYPPTVREIGEAVGLTSSSSVHAQLANLQRRGLIKRDPSKPRAMEIRGPGGSRREGVMVPLLGRISAGAPLLAAEQAEDWLQLPTGYAGEDDHFALRVSGDSMVGAGILDGDVVVVRRQDSADEGDIVVALLTGPAEEEATVKRLHREAGRVMLVPENPSMEPFELTAGQILGKAVAVLRKI